VLDKTQTAFNATIPGFHEEFGMPRVHVEEINCLLKADQMRFKITEISREWDQHQSDFAFGFGAPPPPGNRGRYIILKGTAALAVQASWQGNTLVTIYENVRDHFKFYEERSISRDGEIQTVETFLGRPGEGNRSSFLEHVGHVVLQKTGPPTDGSGDEN
jgi:hypothetical protein